MYPLANGNRYIRDLQLSLSAPFGEGTQCAIQGLATLGVAFYYCWNLTFVILCTVPLIYLLESYISHWLSIRANQQANKLHLALKYITNAIQSIETVKCFNGEKYELQIFTKITGLAADIYLGVTHLRSIQIGAMQFFTVSVFVQGFWYGSHLVKSGDRNVGQVITTFWASLLAIQGITGFLPQFIVLQKGKAAGGRLQLVMMQISTNDRSQETEGELRPSRCPGDIEFRKVQYTCLVPGEEPLTNRTGHILISHEVGGDCDQGHFSILPSRRDYLRHWDEWIWQEHSGSTPSTILSTRFGADLPRWACPQRARHPLAPAECHAR
jgi:ATP-binding cassette subfamily B (MDR/TAP) protein 1